MASRKKIAWIVVSVLGAGILAGCGAAATQSSSPAPSAPAATSQAPRTHEQQVREDLLAWRDAGGYEAMQAVADDMTSVSDSPTAAELSQLKADIAKARAKPIPASTDTGGYYVKFLDHVTNFVSAYQGDDVFTALDEAGSALEDAQSLSDEVNAVTAT